MLVVLLLVLGEGRGEEWRLRGRSDGVEGGLAGDEDGEGRSDRACYRDHLGHNRRHMVRRAIDGAPCRAPCLIPDTQDVWRRR
ncbi:hypothetical protein GUJ93_ZPchr0012g19772 [Zizania palustris]|uniref:Uncharacterized protein n=1 Tax=Zizania palustris TaxID=103762 RepID=A0A8J5WWK8_ZIZPA|nr:hypothetical protein GUJ93_ZPchr0012g19772 [Zizania palustris]